MKNYNEYTVFDYLIDDDFVKWVKNGTENRSLFWEDHLSTYPYQAEKLAQAKAILQQLQFKDLGLSDKEAQQLLIKIERNIREKNKDKVRRNLLYKVWIPISVAASVLFIVSFFGLLQTVKTQVATTRFGETQNIELPDGSVVILNANSTLTYPTHWRNRQTREVELKGEAFFKVKKSEHKHQKFVVNTEKVGIEVLGTQFNVNTRRNNFQIVLNSGEVSVYQNNMEEYERGRILLSPGEMLTFEEQQGVFSKQSVDTLLYTAWKDNKFILKQTPLNEIIRILEDNFNYTIIVRDSALLTKEFVGTFPKDDPDILFSTLSTSLGVEVNGNTIIFKNK